MVCEESCAEAVCKGTLGCDGFWMDALFEAHSLAQD